VTIRRTLAAAAVATAALSTLALGAGSADAATSGTYCGATQQFDGDVYAQACLTISGYSVFPSLHVTNHGGHAITGVVWVNHNGNYEDYATCYGMTASDPGSWCSAGWDGIGAGGYAQAQAQLVIDGSWSGKIYSPSEYIG
jgi:hypothetical protein